MDLSGRKMDLDYLGVIERPITKSDEGITVTEDYIGDSEGETTEGTQEPQETIEYKGKTIETDGKKYWYLNVKGESIPCFPVNGTAEDGSAIIVCWWDTRSDSYNPF